MSFRQKLLQLDFQYTQKLGIAEKPGPLRRLAAIFAHSGDSWFCLAGLIFIWLIGNEFWKQRAIILAAGVLLSAIIVFAIKLVVRRRRPEGEWGAIYRKTDPHSFPSGHSTRAVMLAVLALSLGPAWFSILLALWAPLVVLARVAMGVHYLSDVLAGAFLGLLIGLLMIQVILLMAA
jgi:undecaprenyl-diphosphatase